MISAALSLQVERPRRLRDALALMREAAEHGHPLTPLAGGTDLYVGINAGAPMPKNYVDLWGIEELRGIERNGRTLVFGALTTYSECIESRAVHKLLPILVAAAREIGGLQIQNRGTLGGNIGNGSPAADAVPVLLAAGATVVLASRTHGERAVPLERYYTGYRQTVRRADELIVRIEVEVPKGKQVFRKVGTRAAQAISKVVMAAVGPRVAFGSVAPTVVRAHQLQAYLEAGGADPEEARRLACADLKPIDDVRSTAHYRLTVAGNLAAELVRAR